MERSFVSAYLCSRMHRVTVNKSTKADGPLIKQSLRDNDTG